MTIIELELFSSNASIVIRISDSISLIINNQINRFVFEENKNKQDSTLNTSKILSEIAIIDSLNKKEQCNSTLRYIELYYKMTENFVLYNTLLRKLDNKKSLLM